MYEGLTELHEEIGATREIARRYELAGRLEAACAGQERIQKLEVEIRARVAAQEIGRPTCMCGHRADQHPDGAWCVGGECDCMEYFAAGGVELFSGIPDAERVYPAKRRTSADGGLPEPREGWIAMTTAFPFDHWANHAAHFLPVEGCHLCREGRR